MDNNFSTQVKEIISYSREEALRLGNDFIGTEHLVLGLIRDGENTAIKILKSLNVDLYELRKEIEMAVKDKTGKNIANINSLPLTKQAEKVIRITVLEAKALKSTQVESEHLMLSILKNKENIATQILNQFDVDYDVFKKSWALLPAILRKPSLMKKMILMKKENSMVSNPVRKKVVLQARRKQKRRYLIILAGTSPAWQKAVLLIRSLEGKMKLKGYHRFYRDAKKIIQSSSVNREWVKQQSWKGLPCALYKEKCRVCYSTKEW